MQPLPQLLCRRATAAPLPWYPSEIVLWSCIIALVGFKCWKRRASTAHFWQIVMVISWPKVLNAVSVHSSFSTGDTVMCLQYQGCLINFLWQGELAYSFTSLRPTGLPPFYQNENRCPLSPWKQLRNIWGTIRIEGVVYWTDCKAPGGRFVMLGYITEIVLIGALIAYFRSYSNVMEFCAI